MTRSTTTKADKANRKQRRTRESLERRGISTIYFLPGENAALYVAATDIGKVIIGANQSTWANWRSLGIGPKYCSIGGKVFYEIAVLREFAKKFEVQTTGDLERVQETAGGKVA